MTPEAVALVVLLATATGTALALTVRRGDPLDRELRNLAGRTDRT
ncbi:hypothetical protein [Streptomyces sp. NPDC002104]